MRRRYLRDSVTGKPYDPITKQYIHEALLDADCVLGDEFAQAAPEPAPAPAPVPEPALVPEPAPPTDALNLEAELPDLFDPEP